MEYRSPFKTLILCQTTIAFRAIRSLHFHHLWVCYTVHHIVPPHMWVRHTVRNVDPLHLRFPFPVGSSPSSLCNRSFQSYRNPVNSGSWHFLSTIAFWVTKFLSTVGVDISVDRSFQGYQNSDNFKSRRSCSFQSYLTPGRHYDFRQLSEMTT